MNETDINQHVKVFPTLGRPKGFVQIEIGSTIVDNAAPDGSGIQTSPKFMTPH